MSAWELGPTMTLADICGCCGSTRDLWAVNPEGGYGRSALSVCTACLAGEARDLVPRLLEVYPEEDAAALRAAIANSQKPPENSQKRRREAP